MELITRTARLSSRHGAPVMNLCDVIILAFWIKTPIFDVNVYFFSLYLLDHPSLPLTSSVIVLIGNTVRLHACFFVDEKIHPPLGNTYRENGWWILTLKGASERESWFMISFTPPPPPVYNRYYHASSKMGDEKEIYGMKKHVENDYEVCRRGWVVGEQKIGSSILSSRGHLEASFQQRRQ